jgi:hypothetical protein
MVVVESAKHLFGQQFCLVYEGKAKSCLQLLHQELHFVASGQQNRPFKIQDSD